MSTKEALKVLVGSITVYGVMAACSSASHPPVTAALADVNMGGSRLKANYYAGSDGSQQFLSTFHDTQRNEDCSFGLASDGTTRCLPSPSAPTGPMQSMYSVYYSDAACTTPIVAVSTCSGNTAPKYVSVGGLPGGKTAPSVYALGSVTTVGTAYQFTYTQSAGTANACASPFSSLTPTCLAIPAMSVDAGMSDDAGGGPPLVPPLAGTLTWSSVEASSMIYSLVEAPPSDFVRGDDQDDDVRTAVAPGLGRRCTRPGWSMHWAWVVDALGLSGGCTRPGWSMHWASATSMVPATASITSISPLRHHAESASQA